MEATDTYDYKQPVVWDLSYESISGWHYGAKQSEGLNLYTIRQEQLRKEPSNEGPERIYR